MSTENKRNTDDQEIDLALISKKISGFFQGINTFIFRIIQFFVSKVIILSILFFIGIGLGVYLDKTQKTYDHQIIVQPNFGSTDYLYSKIDLLQSKIKERDTIFLKSIGIKDPKDLTDIEIKPVVDIYRFINSNSEQNFELLKLMAEDGDIKKIVEEKTTSKNYTYHVISIRTNHMISSQKTIAPLLKYLNTSEFFSKIQKEYINNVLLKMKANDLTIVQIDSFLNSFSNTVNGQNKNDKLVYYNENTQLNDVIVTKDKLTKEQGILRVELVGLDEIIKENSKTLNIENTQSVNGKLKLILPFLFIFIYILIYSFKSFYKKQLLKRQGN